LSGRSILAKADHPIIHGTAVDLKNNIGLLNHQTLFANIVNPTHGFPKSPEKLSARF